jgi:hypothetical protein
VDVLQTIENMIEVDCIENGRRRPTGSTQCQLPDPPKLIEYCNMHAVAGETSCADTNKSGRRDPEEI